MALRNLLLGLRNLFGKRRGEQELEDELQDFLGHSVDAKSRAGLSLEEARRRANIEMGGFESVKEKVRDATWESRVESLWSDLRFGLRLLRLNPVFATAAIASLALGIGANTAIFQLLDAVRLRTLPVKNPQELARVMIDHRHTASGNFSTRYSDLTYAMWQEIRARQQGFSQIFAWAPGVLDISPGGEVQDVQGLFVSGEFFDTLGVSPALGRLINSDDDEIPCNSAGLVLSYAFWQHHFGGDPAALQRTITVNGHPFPIIGVSQSGFYGIEVGHYFDLALPLCADGLITSTNQFADSRLAKRSDWWLSVIGRLKPGWTVEHAASQVRAVSPEIFQASLPPEFNPLYAKQFLKYKLTAVPADTGISDLRANYESPLCVLLALAALVLLIAAANLANLLLARASAREREMAMRMAVGAGRGRLIRQLILESLLLAGIGAVLGALLARVPGQGLIAWLSTQDNPLFVDLGVDWRVLGFAAGLALCTCLLFGLVPAFRATRVAPATALKESAQATTGRTSGFSLRRLLVISQVALSLTLLVGGLLFARSLNNLNTLQIGFRQNGVLVADIDFSSLHLALANRTQFSDELVRQVRAIPGVDSAARAAIVPLSGDGMNHDILPLDSEPEGEPPVADFNRVSPGFFDVMGMRLLAGRDFDDHDRLDSLPVAIVDETFAKKFAPSGKVLGMRFRVRELKTITVFEVVGVVQDSKYFELREEPQPIVYTPAAQYARPGEDTQILIHSGAPLSTVITAVQAITAQIGAHAEVSFSPLRTTIENGLVRDKLMARLSGLFGGLAVVLAVIGIYGVISYSVARRRGEVGIRMVLGAQSSAVLRLLLREALWLLAIGLAGGTLLALAAGRAVSSMLFGLKPTDVGTFAAAWLLLSFVALLAAFLPAYRAARSDPMNSLRTQ